MKDVKLFLSDLFPAIGEVVDEALLLICNYFISTSFSLLSLGLFDSHHGTGNPASHPSTIVRGKNKRN